MAEPLAQEAQYGSGHNVLGGIDRETYFRLLERYEAADEAVAEAVGDRKNLRSEIKGLGIKLRAFDRARRDSEIPGEKREEEELQYRQMMSWRLKPVGFQASFDLPEGHPDHALNDHELQWIERQGVEAGRGGHRRDSNSYTPGTAAYVQWDNGWLDGSAAHQANGEDAGPAPRRGRPRGSRNRPKTTDEAIARAQEHLDGDGEQAGDTEAGQPVGEQAVSVH